MEITKDQWIRAWERYASTRQCPVCGSENIADIHRGRQKKFENCLECDWHARSPGLGHCEHEADEDILNAHVETHVSQNGN